MPIFSEKMLIFKCGLMPNLNKKSLTVSIEYVEPIFSWYANFLFQKWNANLQQTNKE